MTSMMRKYLCGKDRWERNRRKDMMMQEDMIDMRSVIGLGNFDRVADATMWMKWGWKWKMLGLGCLGR